MSASARLRPPISAPCGAVGSRSTQHTRRPPSRLQAGVRALCREGLIRVGAKIAARIRQRLWVTETHLWYEVSPDTAALNRHLPLDTQLVPGYAEDLYLLDELPTSATEREARRRLADRPELWHVIREEEPVAALATIARRIDRRVTHRLLAKIERDNRASRRAFRKAGFRVARMQRTERGLFRRQDIEPTADGAGARLLTEQLGQSPRPDQGDA
jgi:hypothetical protein